MGADAGPDEAAALLPLAEECGLSAQQARTRIRRILGVMTSWRDVARRHGIREQEITMMAESIETRIATVDDAIRM